MEKQVMAREAKRSTSSQTPDVINLNEVKLRKISDLMSMARNIGIISAAGMRKQELIFSLLQAQSKKGGIIYGSGGLETLPSCFDNTVTIE